MKVQADTNRVKDLFKWVQVLLKLQPYPQSSVINTPFPKLLTNILTPVILEKIGSVAYKLQLPNGRMMHPVFSCFSIEGLHTLSYTGTLTS
jgi:hypothetical protein